MTEYTFTARLAMLIGIDLAITVIDSFVPQDLHLVRMPIAALQLVFMTVTMAVALRRVLEDY